MNLAHFVEPFYICRPPRAIISMSEEPLEPFKGQLSGAKVTLKSSAEGELEVRGFGEREGERLILKAHEVLFLMYTSKLELYARKKKVPLENMVEVYTREDPQAWTKFLIYRDLRSRGYVAKEGFGFGADFRVYERGSFGSKPAKYVVFGVNEGTEITTEELADAVRKITRMGKEPIIAVLERRGEVIYYRVSRMRFQKA